VDGHGTSRSKQQLTATGRQGPTFGSVADQDRVRSDADLRDFHGHRQTVGQPRRRIDVAEHPADERRWHQYAAETHVVRVEGEGTPRHGRDTDAAADVWAGQPHGKDQRVRLEAYRRSFEAFELVE